MAQSCFDLDAPIIPRTSAAGFVLGQKLDEMSHLLSIARIEKVRLGFNAVRASEENDGLLYLEYEGWSSLEYCREVVRLDFNDAGELSCIWLFSGYRGYLLDRIQIGCSMRDVKEMMPIFYDDGDEMFYPDREVQADLPSGVGFVALEEEDTDSDWLLQGISVHDYERF
jgi:hypothetical protein